MEDPELDQHTYNTDPHPCNRDNSFLSLKFIFYYKNIQIVHNQVLQDSAPRGAPAAARNNAQTTNAVNIIQQEWFKLSSTKTSNPLDVEDYLDFIENMSKDLLEQVSFVFLSSSV